MNTIVTAMSDYTISHYKHRDFASVVELLQRVLPCEPITEGSFTRRVLLDPNFDHQGAFTAHNTAGDVIGFLLALVRRRPLEDASSDADRGWITLYGVAEQARNQGVGSELLQAAETWLREQGRSTVWISPYAPNYWTPGVDENACAAGLVFLQCVAMRQSTGRSVWMSLLSAGSPRNGYVRRGWILRMPMKMRMTRHLRRFALQSFVLPIRDR